MPRQTGFSFDETECAKAQAEHPEWKVTPKMVNIIRRRAPGRSAEEGGLSLEYKMAMASGSDDVPTILEYLEADAPLMPLLIALMRGAHQMNGAQALAKQFASEAGVPWETVLQCKEDMEAWVADRGEGWEGFVRQVAKSAAVAITVGYGGAALAGGGGAGAGAGGAAGASGSAGGAAALSPVSVPASASTMAVPSAAGVVMPSAATAGAATLQSMPAASAIAQAGGASAAEATSVLAKAKDLAPQVVERVNQARTLKAVAEGEAPPPPIDLEGESFTDWAVSLGKGYMEEKLRDKQQELTEAEQRELDRRMQAEVRRLQREAAAELPPEQRRWEPGPDTEAIFEAGESARLEAAQKWLKGGVALGALAILYTATRPER